MQIGTFLVNKHLNRRISQVKGFPYQTPGLIGKLHRSEYRSTVKATTTCLFQIFGTIHEELSRPLRAVVAVYLPSYLGYQVSREPWAIISFHSTVAPTLMRPQ